MQRIRTFVEQTLLVWLILASVVFFQLGSSEGQGRELISWAKQNTMQAAVMLAMFCIGFLLPPEEFREVLRRWKSVLGGTFTQYMTMPLLAWLITVLFQFEGALRVGIILVGCVPGAMASNILTLTARGNVSYSICLTTAATLLSPFVIPVLLLMLVGDSQRPDPWLVFENLVNTVALPVLVGFAVKSSWRSGLKKVDDLVAVIANVAIVWIIGVAVGENAERLGALTLWLGAGLLLINLGGYVAGWYSGGLLLRLDTPSRRALTLEIGMQNAGVGTMQALSLFPDPLAAVPTATYTFGCMLTGTLLANYWNRSSVQAESESAALPAQE